MYPVQEHFLSEKALKTYTDVDALENEAYPGAIIPFFTRICRPALNYPKTLSGFEIFIVNSFLVDEGMVILQHVLTEETICVPLGFALILYYENLVRKQTRVPKHSSWYKIPEKGICELCFNCLLPSARILLCHKCPAMFHYTCFVLSQQQSFSQAQDFIPYKSTSERYSRSLKKLKLLKKTEIKLSSTSKFWICPYCRGLWTFKKSIATNNQYYSTKNIEFNSDLSSAYDPCLEENCLNRKNCKLMAETTASENSQDGLSHNDTLYMSPRDIYKNSFDCSIMYCPEKNENNSEKASLNPLLCKSNECSNHVTDNDEYNSYIISKKRNYSDWHDEYDTHPKHCYDT